MVLGSPGLLGSRELALLGHNLALSLSKAAEMVLSFGFFSSSMSFNALCQPGLAAGWSMVLVSPKSSGSGPVMKRPRDEGMKLWSIGTSGFV